MANQPEDVVDVEEVVGGMPLVKWDDSAFEQIVYGLHFNDIWDATFSSPGQTMVDAPAGYITLYADYFHDGNFRLPATNFFGEILSFYQFHISQLSPLRMVRILHFEFCCWSQGLEPMVDLGCFTSCSATWVSSPSLCAMPQRRSCYPLLKASPEWKSKYFYIREEEILVALVFYALGEIEKETLPIAKKEEWYQKMLALPNKSFGEQTLVTACMSDRWNPDSLDVPIYVQDGVGRELFHRAFEASSGTMEVR
ncbi:hypothetical protein HanPI659440_Chr12g0469461 [Helianthus annuus]|nr:hypothetical protein HanIR_Chr12g0595811 [Helianthus annuus]KAJ0726362.1 hypothetical protein HanPI659440_Chr12g0469461 [Helianthus annuus]